MPLSLASIPRAASVRSMSSYPRRLCLLDEAAEVAVSLKCPSCQAYLPVNQPGPSTTNPIYNAPRGVTIPTRYHNEGGVEENNDILPELTEEAYLISHPEARLARAFHTMCAEGDVVGILGVIKDAGEATDGESMPGGELLRYQDPLNSMKSGLHLAVEKNLEQVCYLLLFLASQLPTESFPADVLQSAKQIDLARRQGRGDDIRTLRGGSGGAAGGGARGGGGPGAARGGRGRGGQ